MNLKQLQDLLHDATKQDSQLGIFPTYLNTAVKMLCQRRSWMKMKDTLSFSLTVGLGVTSTYNLPATFKEPQSGKNPLRGTAVASGTGVAGWILLSKQEVQRLAEVGVGAAQNKAYIENTNADGVQVLTVIGQDPAGSVTFSFDVYKFPADMAAASDSNFMTADYPMMVLEQAKMMAFRQSGNPDLIALAEDCQKTVEFWYDLAIKDDAYRSVRGRTWRMGGW